MPTSAAASQACTPLTPTPGGLKGSIDNGVTNPVLLSTLVKVRCKGLAGHELGRRGAASSLPVSTTAGEVLLGF